MTLAKAKIFLRSLHGSVPSETLLPKNEASTGTLHGALLVPADLTSLLDPWSSQL